MLLSECNKVCFQLALSFLSYSLSPSISLHDLLTTNPFVFVCEWNIEVDYKSIQINLKLIFIKNKCILLELFIKCT